jgi:hypothetical protein
VSPGTDRSHRALVRGPTLGRVLLSMQIARVDSNGYVVATILGPPIAAAVLGVEQSPAAPS